jgi:hypothetical protein
MFATPQLRCGNNPGDSMKYAFPLAIAVLSLCCGFVAAAPPAAELIQVDKIWDEAPHCAFTDLTLWRGKFYCAFREGRRHVSSDGKIRVLNSPDANSWKSAGLVSLADFDLRDAGLSTTPDGRLMLLGGAAPRKNDGDSSPTGTFVSFSEDGATWTTPKIVVQPGRWLWRVTWHDGMAYGVSYAASEGKPFTSLLGSKDGVEFGELVPKMFGEGYPTEATLRFTKDNTMLCLQRRDGAAANNSAYLGISQPPYTDWQWHDLKAFLGGPNFIQIPSGQWISAGRMVQEGGPKTVVAALDVEQKTLTPLLTLPSGGDSSYPGLVWHDDTLFVSYYSSHENKKTSIYLAKVRIK